MSKTPVATSVASDAPRILSFGGGVQSHALLALLGQGKYPIVPPSEVWFCDPKGERPGTYEFIQRITLPYCEKKGIPFLRLEKHSRIAGESLLESYRRRGQYPLRQNRQCTIDWKIKVMEAECKRRGWHKTTGVEKHIGISMDELQRARSGDEGTWEKKRYPLIEARMFRDACERICIEEFGEAPIKSGCWFCKYQRVGQWRDVWEERADGRWQLAVDWEKEVMVARPTAHPFVDRLPLRTLEEWAEIWALGTQDSLFLDVEAAGACDGGYCMV